MRTFLYQGTNINGKPVSGSLQAASAAEARAVLARKGIEAAKIASESGVWGRIFKGVSLKEIAKFTRQFAAMLLAGVSLSEALSLFERQLTDKRLKNAITSISGQVKSGISLTTALQQHPAVFNDLYCSMVEVGETTGTLPDVLSRLAQYLDRSAAIRRKIRTALAYPATVVCIAVGVIAALMAFVVPTFAAMFKDMGKELPVLTRLIIGLSNGIANHAVFVLLAVVLMIVVLIRAFKSDKGKFLAHAYTLKMPYAGDLMLKSSSARFARTLATLLKSGVRLTGALPIAARTSGNMVLHRKIGAVVKNISAGAAIAEQMQATGVFDPMLVQMAGVGERTGNLAEMLDYAADFYEGEVNASIDAFISILEPVFIVVLAAVVGVILVSMYLPMFDIVTGMQ